MKKKSFNPLGGYCEVCVKRAVKMLSARKMPIMAFTLVEMLMALLIVSIILTASLPVITTRQKAMASSYNQNRSFPIGGIIVWYHQNLPDSTWLECNGQKIPDGIEYESARQVFGTNLPNFQGLFLRGYGSQSFSQNNGSTVGVTSTTHTSANLGIIQGDAIRNITGSFFAKAVESNRYNAGAFYTLRYNFNQNSVGTTNGGGTLIAFDSSRVIPVSNEIRPINIAVKYIAKVRY